MDEARDVNVVAVSTRNCLVPDERNWPTVEDEGEQ